MSPKDAFYKTVHNAPGGHVALAIRLGMSPAVLRNKANVNSVTNKPMLDDVDNIIGLTGDASVLHALAAKHGYVCVKQDDADIASEKSVLGLVMKWAASNGDVARELDLALEDGRIDLKELAAIEDAVYRDAKAQQQLLARVRRMAGRARAEGGDE